MRPRPLRRLAIAVAAAGAVSLALDRTLPAGVEGAPPPVVRYDLDAALDAEAHVVRGRGTMAWRSDAKVPVDHAMLHLYLNAFRDRESALLTEGTRANRVDGWDEGCPGSVEVTALRGQGGADLLPAATHVAAPGAPPGDRTVLRVPLPAPVRPGEELVLEVEFESRLPRAFCRTGHGGDFHMVAQWFPKFAVWEDAGEGGAEVAGWNAHAYHRTSEFFADFGTYDVRVRVPAAYRGRVGGTGRRTSERDEGDGTVTVAFHAEAVHDFAWVCGRDYVVHVERFPGGDGGDPEEAARVAAALKRTVSDLRLPPVEVTFLIRPENEPKFERHRRAVFAALGYMGLWYGPYPYPTLTVVDPDARGRAAGGMEYPTLITCGTSLGDEGGPYDPEAVCVHEFGHQHFYGLLASNEFEDAWMDEGMTTYATARVLARAYPHAVEPGGWLRGVWPAGEPPFPFAGARVGLAAAGPGRAVSSWTVPWGRLEIVRRAGRAFGFGVPDHLAVWPAHGDAPHVAWLREVPPLGWLRERRATPAERERLAHAEAPATDDLVGRAAWEHLDPRAYGRTSYARAACMLRTLEGLLGEATMTVVMRTYAERFRWRHPTPEDFFRTADEVASERGRGPLGWFFDEFARPGATRTLDFGVAAVDPGEEAEDGTHASSVTLRRFGDARFPVTVWVGLDDGRTVRRLRWDLDDRVRATDGGPEPEAETPPEDRQYRWAKIRLRGPAPVAWATTDPERLVSLEGNRLNDGRRARPDGRAANRIAVRALGWVEQATTFWGGL